MDMAYTEQQRADALVALEANRGNIKQTAIQLGIGEATLHRWIDENSDNGDIKSDIALATSELVPAARKGFIVRLVNLRDKALQHLEEHFEDLTARETVVALGILIDKVELLEGNATSRTAVVGNGETIDEAITRITNELESRISRTQVLEVESSTTGFSESEPTASTGELVELASDGGSGIWQDQTGGGNPSVESSPQ
jgi:transposase-like protein